MILAHMLVQLLVPIAICVVLPVLIVYIVFRAANNSDNNRTKVLIEAIHSSNAIDADKLAETLKKPVKSARETLNSRLLKGCLFTLAGIGLLIALTIIVNPTDGVSIASDTWSTLMIASIISIAIGISFLITYLITRKQVDKDDK